MWGSFPNSSPSPTLPQNLELLREEGAAGKCYLFRLHSFPMLLRPQNHWEYYDFGVNSGRDSCQWGGVGIFVLLYTLLHLKEAVV